MIYAKLTRTVSAVAGDNTSLRHSSVVRPVILNTECSTQSSGAASLYSLMSFSTPVLLKTLNLFKTLACPHVSPVSPEAVQDLLAEGDVSVRVVRHHLVGQSPAPVGALLASHTELRLGVD